MDGGHRRRAEVVQKKKCVSKAVMLGLPAAGNSECYLHDLTGPADGFGSVINVTGLWAVLKVQYPQ